MDDFIQKLEQQQQRHREEMADTQDALFPENNRRRVVMPDLANLSIDEAIVAYGAWAEAAISGEQEAFVARQQPIAPELSPVNEAVLRAELAQKSAAEQLTFVDDIVEELFDIRRIFPDVRHETDVIFCNTTAAFVQPLREIGLTEAEQNRLIAQAETGDFSGPVLSHVAYYLPDDGCYVNGALLADGGDPERAVDEPEIFFRAVEAIAQAMWGWGFFIDYSAAGQQRKAAGLWRQEVAAQLGLVDLAADYPPVAAQVREYALLLETGWSVWIGEMVTQAARRKKLGGWEKATLPPKDFIQLLKEMVYEIVQELGTETITGGEYIQGWLPFHRALKRIISSHEQGQYLLHRIMQKYKQVAQSVDGSRGDVDNKSTMQGLSKFIFSQVERQVGSFCVPYAVLIAAHVSYELASETLSDLPNNPALFPEGNPDSRFLLLSYLDQSVKYDVSSMAIAAWDALKLTSPTELRHA